MEDVMRRFFRRQSTVVLARLQGKQARKDTRHWTPPGEKALDVQRIFQMNTWDAQLRADIEPILVQLYAEVGRGVFDAFGIADAAFNVHQVEVSRAIERRVNKITNINKTTADAIRTQISSGELAGESIPDIASRVRSAFSDASTYRSRLIARTEVVGGSNEGNHLAAKQSGVVQTKQWLSAHDARVRPEHVAMDGETVLLANDFSNGLQFPEEPNCRCVCIFSDEAPAEAILG